MHLITGADIVLPDRILSPGSIVIEEGRIAEVSAGTRPASGPTVSDLWGHLVLPGFIDVHVHGVDGLDALDGGNVIAALARALPRYGVVAFCPTTVACPPEALRDVLRAVREARVRPAAGCARVLPAHLETNFVNPEFCGAQPLGCLRLPPAAETTADDRVAALAFTAGDVLAEIDRAEPDIGILTLAPELEGGLDLVRRLRARGHRISLGHSGATFEQAKAAIAAGARQATHLFNRMPPLHHREPGLAGAVLQSEEVCAEIICDGVHVHPAVVATAVAAKHVDRIMAITDGTAAAGRPGGEARLGGRPIVAQGRAAYLEDGTLAGSVQTMDGAFRMLTELAGLSVVEAARLCATNPARTLDLQGHGVIASGAPADLVVLDRSLTVVRTYIAGRQAFQRNLPLDGVVSSRRDSPV